MFGSIIANGGLVLVAIGLASVVGLTVVLERCWRLVPLRRRWVQAPSVSEMLTNPQSAADPAHPVGRAIQAGLSARSRGAEAMRTVALDAAQRDVQRWERGLGTLATVAQITPLLGLLGTVAGLMEAFTPRAMLRSSRLGCSPTVSLRPLVRPLQAWLSRSRPGLPTMHSRDSLVA